MSEEEEVENEITIERVNEDLHAFRKLVESPAWGILKRIAEEQIRLRENQILHSEDFSFDATLGRNILLGERKGMKTLMSLPETVIEQLEEKQQEMKDESE